METIKEKLKVSPSLVISIALGVLIGGAIVYGIVNTLSSISELKKQTEQNTQNVNVIVDFLNKAVSQQQAPAAEPKK